jgi:branched-chain amino acid transport system permease protein
VSDDVKTSDGGTESARAREPDPGALVDSLGLWAPRGNEVRVVALSAAVIAAFPYLFSRAPVLDGLVQGYQGLATLVLIWGIFALGFDLLLGYTGLLSFGHAAFWGGAAYAAGIFSSQVSGAPILMVAAGTAFALLLAWVLGFLSLRRGGIYFSILTLAFGQMMFYISSSPLASLTGGENGFTDVQTAELLGLVSLESDLPGVLETLFGTWLYVFVGVLTLVCIAFAYRLLNSPYGIVFRAIRENEQRAEFVGRTS